MDFNNLRNKRILVTGSTGFKGSWLCTWLLSLGADVYGFALPPKSDAPLFDQLRLRGRIVQHDGDIRDADGVKKVLNKIKPDAIFHLAAQAIVHKSYSESQLTFDTNVSGAVNLLEAVKSLDTLCALVFVASDKVYKNKEWLWGYRENDELGGHDPYSASKAAAELIFDSYQNSFFTGKENFGAASVRAGNVIGGGDFSADRIVPDCIRAFQKDQEVVLRNPLSTRPWQHVLEPLSGYMTVANQLIEKPQGSGAWNFGPDPENVRTVQELTELVISILGTGSIKIEQDKSQPHEANLLMLNSDKAKTKLGWRPQWNFEEAVRNTVLWYEKVNQGDDPVAVTEQQLATYLKAGK
jgi:CDP-glucose 4,6-dehydratase